MSDERFIEIETKIAHQEVLMEELHQVLYKQQETIDQLQKVLQVVIKRNSDDPQKSIGPANEKPPHY